MARSGLDAATVAGFLFENYTVFVDDPAIDDAAAAAARFSDAMHMIRRSADAWGAACGLHCFAAWQTTHCK